MSWIRVETNVGSNDKIHQFARGISVEFPRGLGHLVCLWGGIAEHRVDGNLEGVLSETLEEWAKWRGRPGRFAKAFRKAFVGSDGVVIGWRERQGKLIERAEKDRARKSHGSSEEIPSLRNDTIRNKELNTAAQNAARLEA